MVQIRSLYLAVRRTDFMHSWNSPFVEKNNNSIAIWNGYEIVRPSLQNWFGHWHSHFTKWGNVCFGPTCDPPSTPALHDDVIKWKHFPRNWSSVRGIHWLPMNSPHKGQWRGALMFSLIYTGTNGWVTNGEAGDLRLSRPLWRHCNDAIPSDRLKQYFIASDQS